MTDKGAYSHFRRNKNSNNNNNNNNNTSKIRGKIEKEKQI
jgi:hypothetical protein